MRELNRFFPPRVDRERRSDVYYPCAFPILCHGRRAAVWHDGPDLAIKKKGQVAVTATCLLVRLWDPPASARPFASDFSS